MTSAVLLAVGVGLAGGVGSMLRVAIDSAVRRHHTNLPVGILAVNITGSLLLGIVAGLALNGLLPAPWRVLLGAGFLGGYTTFSTAMQDSVGLWREERRRTAVANVIGTSLGGTGAAALGYLLGLAIPH